MYVNRGIGRFTPDVAKTSFMKALFSYFVALSKKADPNGSASFYDGFVDHSPAVLTKTLGINFKLATTYSARSSGCITFSSLHLTRFVSMAKSVTTVLGVKAVTRTLCFLTSSIGILCVYHGFTSRSKRRDNPSNRRLWRKI